MARTMNYFYIIKVECGKVHKTWYKIGESDTNKRPNTLVEKYMERRSNTAELVTIQSLPHNNERRLTDKAIHKYLTTQHKNAVAHVDKVHVEYYLGEKDGADEFFEVIQPGFDLVDCVNTFATTCNASLYTGRVEEETKLSYGKDKYHLVDNMLIEKILTKFPIVDRMLYKEFNNNILLIGQFEHDFVASFAMRHNVVILHDGKDNIHQFEMARLNNAIKYIETVEDLYTMNIKFDLIIANPPYNKPGANITKNIIDNVYFEEYVNLLPANDYKRNTEKNLFQYAREMESINDGFDDAVVTTHLCKIAKEPNNITLDEFEISNYTDRSLDKYFIENSKRTHYAIDKVPATGLTIKNAGVWDIDKTFIFHNRDMNHTYMGDANSTTYKWNVEKSIVFDDITNRKQHTDESQLTFCNINFSTAVERTNFTKFVYENSNFIAKLWKALNIDMGIKSIGIPKVDWTRSWTVEEILKDYGYTDLEIENIMADLDNFKGMDD